MVQRFLSETRPDEKLRLALLCLSGGEPPECVKEYLRCRSYAAMKKLCQKERYAELADFLKYANEASTERLLREDIYLTSEARAILMKVNQAPITGNEPIPELIKIWLKRISLKHPSLRRVLSLYTFRPACMDFPMGTDGETIYYDESRFTRDYAASNGYADCIHMILHCLFFHLDIPLKEEYHNAADYAADNLQAWLFPESNFVSHEPNITDIEEILPLKVHVSPHDDHRFWHKLSPCISHRMLWKQAAEGVGAAYGNHRFGLNPGSRADKFEKRRQAQHDFSGYLRRFSEIREEQQVDPESIDYIPYYYGLQRYGNLPLIAPLEYQEIAKVREMVIAIDTSGSCSEATVQQFLAETRRILTEQANFFKRMNVCFVQCDSMVQDVQWIQSVEDWNRYEENISILGRGGTNFRPVFDLIAKMQKEGKLRYLRGLLYFTDGDGLYPKVSPSYEVAFVSSDERILEYKTPQWCRKLILKRENTP